MQRIIVPVIALAALICMLAATAALAAPEAPKTPVEMKYPADSNKFAPIMFEHHAGHLGVEGGCATCHHKWDGKAEIQSCTVKGCHADISSEHKSDATSYDSAFHARTAAHSCVGCHRTMGKGKPKFKGPTKCNDCHTRK